MDTAGGACQEYERERKNEDEAERAMQPNGNDEMKKENGIKKVPD
jgi:hypothetical protein